MAENSASNPMWNAILKWSLSQTSQEPSSDPANRPKPMSEEDRRFLSEAMASMVVDEIGVMKRCIATLDLPTDPELLSELSRSAAAQRSSGTEETISAEELTPESVVQKKLDALEELSMLVLTVDRAVDFRTVGGLPPLLRLLEVPAIASQPEVASAAAEVLGSMTANNEKTQVWAQEHDAVEILLAGLRLVLGERPDDMRYPLVQLPLANPESELREPGVCDASWFDKELSPALRSDETRLKLTSKLLLALGCLVRNSSSGLDLMLVPGCRGFSLILDVTERAVQDLSDLGAGNAVLRRLCLNVLQKCLRLVQFFCDETIVPQKYLCVPALAVHQRLRPLLESIACNADMLEPHLRECAWETIDQFARSFRPLRVVAGEQNPQEHTLFNSAVECVGQTFVSLIEQRALACESTIARISAGELDSDPESQEASRENAEDEFNALRNLLRSLGRC